MNVGVANRIRDTVSITANKLEKRLKHSRPIGLKLHVHVYKRFRPLGNYNLGNFCS